MWDSATYRVGPPEVSMCRLIGGPADGATIQVKNFVHVLHVPVIPEGSLPYWIENHSNVRLHVNFNVAAKIANYRRIDEQTFDFTANDKDFPNINDEPPF